MFLTSNNLEKYITKSTDIKGKRKYERLPVTIPILYRFPDSKKKSSAEFRQCNTVDMSRDGIGIQVINPPDDVNEKLKKTGQKIILRVQIPKTEDLIEFSGLTRWAKTEKFQNNFQVILGVEFDEVDYDKKVSMVSYALGVKRKKQQIRLIIASLLILFLGASAWGAKTLMSKQNVEIKLEVSETQRTQLKKEITELIEKKSKIEDELESNAKKIELQAQNLTKQNELLEKSNKELEKSKEELKSNKQMISMFEAKVFDYVVVSENENIFIELGSELSAFRNETYIAANKALENKKPKEAIALFKKYISENPTSSLGYSGLSRALFRADREQEARETFKKYLQLVDKAKISEQKK